MSRITAECEARIKQSANIVDLLGRYIQIRRAGSAWKACCPFHQEKTPSFHINPTRQSFHCFGCGVGGDAIKFLMLFENLSYPDALRRLADVNGIPIIEEEESPELMRRRRQRQRVVELNKLATDYFHRLLCRAPEAAHVRDYLKSRQINIEIARAWQLGWAPHSMQDFIRLAQGQGFSHENLVDAYLLGSNERGSYPVFRDRLMFPIMNVRGEVVGFSGRVMDEQKDPRKYVNTSETVAFRKSELLFGLNKATSAIGKKDMSVLICEGQIDVIACHEKAELRHAVAGLGTAFTDEHATTLRKYAKRAILCYDGDKAGIAAAEKTYRKLAIAGLDVYQAPLPMGEDPDSLINQRGAEALQQAVEQARPYLEIRCAQELAQQNNDAVQKARFIDEMIDLVADIPDSTRRDLSIVELATRLNLGIELMRNNVNDKLAERKNAPAPRRLYDNMQDSESNYLPDEAVTIAPPARAVSMHPTMRGIIQLAAINKIAQQQLLDRIEDLYEAIEHFPGGSIIMRFFEHLPMPGDEGQWQSFLQSLSPEEAAALRDIEHQEHDLRDIEDQVTLCCEKTLHAHILQQIDQLKSQLRNPALSAAEKQLLLTQVTELRQMIQ